MSKNTCICIPKLDESVTKNFIYTVFEKYNIGNIKKIHLVQLKNKNNKLGFIYFHNLNNNKNGELVKKCLENEEDFKVMYSFPWYWKCYKAKN